MSPRPPAWNHEKELSVELRPSQPFDEQHSPVSYWARRWGFSPKTVREWFRDEYGAGILRQANAGRRKKRDYITLTISASAAARIYAKRIIPEAILRRTREVM